MSRIPDRVLKRLVANQGVLEKAHTSTPEKRLSNRQVYLLVLDLLDARGGP